MTGRLLAVGDNVVDRYVQLGIMYPGGNAVNVAVHARRCGLNSAYLGALGTDTAGDLLLAALRKEAVDTSLARIVAGPNAYATVRVVAGNRTFGTLDVGVSKIRLTAAELEAANSFDIVHTGECSMVEEQLGDLAEAVKVLSFDFSERPWGYVAEYARHATVAIRSMPAADVLAGRREAQRLQDLGPRVVAVTLGAGGAVVLDGQNWIHAPAPGVDTVDTLGAGDAFIARLLTGLVMHEPLTDMATAATAYASANCLSHGAFGYEAADPGSFPKPRAGEIQVPAVATAAGGTPATLEPNQQEGVDRP